MNLKWFGRGMMLFSLCGLVSGETAAAERWYHPVDIGMHVSPADKETTPLPPQEALALFSADGGDPRFSPLGQQKFLRLKEEWIRKKFKTYPPAMPEDPAHHPADGAPAPLVRAFSKDRVVIGVVFQTGFSRWHHYYELIASYLIPRTKEIDALFGLVELEKQYRLEYKGVRHGMPFGEAIEKILGPYDCEYAGQSPQFRNIYYLKHDLEIVVQDGTIKYLKRGRQSCEHEARWPRGS